MHDLAHVLDGGASIRRSRLRRDAGLVAPSVGAAAVAAAAIYLATVTRTHVPSWRDVAIVASSLALLPVIISFLLLSLRDNGQPLTLAGLMTVSTSALVVAVLSALRLHISYWGVLLAAIPVALAMIVVMLQLRRAENDSVALLAFDGAETVRGRLGTDVAIADGTDADLRAYDRFLIDAAHHSGRWSRFLLRAHMRGIPVTPWMQFLEQRHGRVDIASFDIADVVLRPGQIVYSRVKRIFDLGGALLALPVALLAGGLVGLYILLAAGRPVLFRQKRRGHGGETFIIVKFRTMRTDADSRPASENDDRVVPALRAVRRLRLDEIPQLYNILRGEMSWIGPRPATVEVAEATEAVEPKFASRLLVRPGLTGWAQVNAAYASTVAEEIEKLGYDLYYVKNMSFDLDLIIMARTVKTLLLRRGAR